MVDETIKELETLTGRITAVHTEVIAPDEPFMTTAARFAAIPGTVVLLSGGDLDCARWSIIATRPFLTFAGRCDGGTLFCGDTAIPVTRDPFSVLRQLLTCYRYTGAAEIFGPGSSGNRDKAEATGPEQGGADSSLPVLAGLFGYFAYDLKDAIEELPATTMDDMDLPHMYLTAPSLLLVHDHHTGTTHRVIPERTKAGQSSLAGDLHAFEEIMKGPKPSPRPFSIGRTGLQSNFEKTDYMDSIEKIRDYIRAGHVYQVNMSQRFASDFSGDAFSLFQCLFEDNPAPFFSFIHAGDHFIISTSPERFIKRSGAFVETRPIKGTMPRGERPDQDRRFRQQLEESTKDDAELSMIVDLLRNDIGKVCQGGSVAVKAHKTVETYTNVYHLVSIVTGTLAPGKDSVDLLRATFPGGSITGCPKIRSMEIIDELETVNRHVYTGSIGYVSFHDTMDLSIAIRTATVYNNRLVFSVGGGIVYDSDPLAEYQETLHKGKTLFKVLTGENTGVDRRETGLREHVFINGAVKPLDRSGINIAAPGFQYGHGFFETLRADQGRVHRLEEHLERFYRTWESLMPGRSPRLSWDRIIAQVLAANGLDHATAAVKIIAARGDRDMPPFNPTLCVTARPYVHRLLALQVQALHLKIYGAPRHTPLADYKTLNYLYYFMAGAWAKKNRAHEALILNPDGSMSETNTANIMVLRHDAVLLPASAHVLDGVMQQAACRLLKAWGYTVEYRVMPPDALRDHDRVILTNALMGAVPVAAIEDRQFAHAGEICARLNAALFSC